MPIIDYHCHLEPKEIYENENYRNLTRIWLSDNGIGDHYKWRLLRANGTEEKFITGDGDDYTKFLAFVETIERAIGNPIYEWSHLELKRYFGIDLPINKKNAKTIWDTANAMLSKKRVSTASAYSKNECAFGGNNG
ncbi:glucuronate isomerase [Virgibacillus halophilus]|uniref:Uronate isomerase n=1 Tax=Tigheibacillus halophilus TaxID=361280 RepID=A0ABU5C305_9BACI|nr:glucuronate isomerase [Virgibacillus halophilus]